MINGLYIINANTFWFMCYKVIVWGIERSGFFNGQGKWAKGFENQMV